MRFLKNTIAFIFVFICIFSKPVFSENETALFGPEEKETQVKNYFEYSSSFTDEIECKDILILGEKPVFRLDSDEKTFQLKVQTMPVNATDRKFTYSSSDTSVVSVDENGLLTSHNKGGKAVIKINCQKAEYSLEVQVIRPVSGVSLSRKDMLFYIDEYSSAPLNANIQPADATNKNVTWSSSDTAVAYVDPNGVVSPVGTGYATITATTSDGSFKDICEIYVKLKRNPVIGCFITNAPDALKIGQTYKLTSYIYPQGASNSAVSWQSSNTDVAAVSSDGTITVLAEGLTDISAQTKNGVKDSFTLTTYPAEAEIETNVVSQSAEERIKSLSMPARYTKTSYSLTDAISMQMKASPTYFTTDASKATREQVTKYITPANLNKGYQKYQFLDLSHVNGISEDRLNKYLSDKGILKGKANVFINAAKANGISEVYLAVHCALESGSGTSELACGKEYNGKKVYNLFGIGAYDDDPINSGAKYAYEQGWISIDSAIYGAAQWINSHYIGSGQNTIYKMRWNPEKPAYNQYATDVAWANKQASVLKSLIEGLDESNLIFDVSVYNGQENMAIMYE